MYKLVLSFFFLFLGSSLFSQVSSDYFQQEVNYDINVSLDDQAHSLDGTVDIEYINHSGETLKEIYLHLWPNAYKKRNSAFAKQMIENGSTEFYFAKPNRLGGYKDIDIKVDDKVVQWDYWDGNPDIVLINLSKALAPEASITINTNFLMKIPDSFSRLGHVGESYQMTQWYPKPAVFDNEGWHPMPYLDQGEFYSEFGDFNVNITLPKNYIVGATGVLQTESEIEFINQRMLDKALSSNPNSINVDTFPTSDTEMKTIQYKAENVHDFAWFADKRFQVDKSEVTLASGKKVDTYVMYTNKQANLWKDAIKYVNRSVQFYSEQVGEYPYPQATAVQSALSAGAGMEYPMITVIGTESSAESLDEVITHEVGHNWFYGLLASNERDYAWMDEGFNSYYEKLYMDKYYPLDKKAKNGLLGVSNEEASQLGFYLPMRRHTNQAVNTPSQDLRQLNYWIGAYDMPAYLLSYLEDYLGKDELDRIMNVYFETWKFKHPQPEDVRSLFEKELGKDLSWLFDGLINSTAPLDYKMKSSKKVDGGYQLVVDNVGEINAPFPIQVIEENNVVKTVWVEGFEGEKEIMIDVRGADKFVLDNDFKMPEFNRKNNTITAKGGKFEPLNFKFLLGAENPRKTTVYWTPAVAYNKYDGFMAGLALYNTVLPSKKLEWSLLPMYGFRSKDLSGMANLRYHMYPDKLQRATLELGYKGFSYSYNEDFYSQFEDVSSNLKYRRIRTALELEFNKPTARSNKKQMLKLELISMNATTQGTITVDTTTTSGLSYAGHNNEWSFVPRLNYHLSNSRALTPYALNVGLEQHSYGEDDGYAKLSIEMKTKFLYQKGKAFHLRAFTGFFLYNTKSDIISQGLGAYTLTGQGNSDYWADDYYLGRNEGEGFLSQQFHENQGGFKSPISNSSLGSSNRGLYALNIKVDLPMQFPRYIPNIRPYFDLAYVDNSSNETFNDGLFAQGGIAVEFLQESIGVYFPLVGTDNINTYLKGKGNYPARISFKVNLNRVNPFKILYNYDL